jgi:hypothetical protein
LYLHHFRRTNLCRVDEEEYVASERFSLHRSGSGFWSRCRSGFFYGFWSRSHRSRNHRHRHYGREFAKTEGETTEEVSLPVHVLTILRVELVASHRHKAFDVEAHALAETEVYVSTEATSGEVECVAVPKEEEFIGIELLSSDSFFVVEAVDVTNTNESVERNATVRVVTSEEVREVEHTIKTSVHEVPLIVLRVVVVAPTIFALPSAHVSTEVEHRAELIAEVHTSSRSDNVSKLLVSTVRVTHTTLNTECPVGVELFFGSILSCCAERNSSKSSYEDRLELHNMKV